MSLKTLIAVIDNNETYSSLLTKVIARHDFEPLSINPFGAEIGTILHKLKEASPSLIFLNAEVSFNQNESPSILAGIDFLKHIRLTESLGEIGKIPIVIYSYGSKDGLLRGKPENLILLSPGSYYLNVFDLNRSIAKGLLQDYAGFLLGEQWLEPINDLAQLKPYVEADTRDIILEDRHSIANWWGPQRLLKGYRLTTEKPTIPPGNPVIENFEKEKKKIAVKKLLFIKDSKVSLENSRRKAILNEFPGILRGKEIGNLLINEDGTYKKVLYIDDEAEVGWANAFKQILYPGINEFFNDREMTGNSFAIPHTGEKAFQVFKSFKEAEESISPATLSDFALVILDLRDKRMDTNKIQPDDLSGVKLLKKIKSVEEGDPSIPVVVVTASNKQWNYERVLALGANGYWIKESPEFGIDDEYSLRNYLNLRNMLIEVLNREYLREIWWQGIVPCKANLDKGKKESVFDLLMKAFLNLQYRYNKNYVYNTSGVFPLQDVLLFLALAFEQYTGLTNIRKRDVNVIVYFLFNLRGGFIHGTPTACYLTQEDIKSFFFWFKNLVVQGKDFPILIYDNKSKSHILNAKGKVFEAIRDVTIPNIDLVSPYVNFWNFLKHSGKGTESDSQMIKEHALKIIRIHRISRITFNKAQDIFSVRT